MTRLEFLTEKWSQRVSSYAKLADRHRGQEKPFDILLQADPSPRLIYADFIMRRYLAADFLIEDVERVRSTLSDFHGNKHLLPEESRDINRYQSEHALYDTVKAFLVERGGQVDVSGKETKRADRKRAYEESEVSIVGGWTMAVPSTAFAAAWWGLGTRWCTTNDYTFTSYSARGPLRVFVTPDGDKYQYHGASAVICNASDARVPLEPFVTAPGFPQSFHEAAKADAAAFISTRRQRTGESWRAFLHAVKAFPESFLPGGLDAIRAEMIEEGFAKMKPKLNEYGWRFHVAKSEKSRWAVATLTGEGDESKTYGPSAILTSPDGRRIVIDGKLENLTADIARELPVAFLQSVVHEIFRMVNFDIHVTLLRVAALIADVGADKFSSSFWRAYAKRIAWCEPGPRRDVFSTRQYATELVTALRAEVLRTCLIPDDMFDYGVAGVFADRGLRHRIPDHHLSDPRIVKRLVRANPKLMKDEPFVVPLSDDDIIDITFHSNGREMHRLPRRLRTVGTIQSAVERYPNAIRPVADMLRRDQIDLAGADRRSVMIEVCESALSRSSGALSFIHVPLTRAAYLGAVTNQPALLSLVPLAYRDVEMCKAALKVCNPSVLCHVPPIVLEELRATHPEYAERTDRYKPSLRMMDMMASYQAGGPVPERMIPAGRKPDFECDAPSVIAA